jgi:hypothetical protein
MLMDLVMYKDVIYVAITAQGKEKGMEIHWSRCQYYIGFELLLNQTRLF